MEAWLRDQIRAAHQHVRNKIVVELNISEHLLHLANGNGNGGKRCEPQTAYTPAEVVDKWFDRAVAAYEPLSISGLGTVRRCVASHISSISVHSRSALVYAISC